ncbi:hypothetical protein [Piscinibacter sakaiensis]|uniref:Uncharacterized protein n=1 Tax=Piscinibacter sakaiensis TaxID=1547922 RepID=A0A0K8P284_PISS1|nr:hypothetical protein [Piscinibacter sakaiensis]GAP36723.1 hypothetical protein ISF6_2563 [Piscinibacter sakaiensis]
MSFSMVGSRVRGAVLLSATAAASALAAAQAPTPAPGRADPLDPRAPVPALRYASPLAGYRGLGEDRRIGWQEANERVARIGGWRAYAREAQVPAADPVAPPPSTAVTPVHPHPPASTPAPPLGPTPAASAASDASPAVRHQH